MNRDTILIGAAGGLCGALLIAALVLRHGPGPVPASAGTPDAAAGAAADAAGAAGGESGAAGTGAPGSIEAGAPGAGGAGDDEDAEALGEETVVAEGRLGGSRGEENADDPGAADAARRAAAATTTPFASEQNRREVVLFFQEADSEYLGPERRKIFLTDSAADQAKQIVGELIAGPQDPNLLLTVPPETTLRGLYLDKYATAWVDLSEEVSTRHPGGSADEIATVFSLVDSLTYNLPEIKRVRLLINGEERETLKNHLDLRRDYRQDLSIVDIDRRKPE